MSEQVTTLTDDAEIIMNPPRQSRVLPTEHSDRQRPTAGSGQSAEEVAGPQPAGGDKGVPPALGAAGGPRAGGTAGDKRLASTQVTPDAISAADDQPSHNEQAQPGPGEAEPASAESEPERVDVRRAERRVNPDSSIFIRLIVAGVIVLGLTAFSISFVALMEVSAWLGLPSWMAWAVPVFIDLAILVYAAAVLIHRARGERTIASWTALAIFTVLSVIANSAHALAYGAGDDWQSWIGAGLAATVPIAIFTATEQLARVAVEDPASRRRDLQEASEWEAARAAQEGELLRLKAQRAEQEREVEAQQQEAQRQRELEDEEHRTRIEMARAERQRRIREASQESHEQPEQASAAGAIPSDGAPSTNGTGGGAGQGAGDQSQAGPGTGNRAGASRGMEQARSWVADQVTAGEEPTSSGLAEVLGVSERTARRRLRDVRTAHPELFGDDAGEEGNDED